ncbi:MAG TPA: response regulator transcription factor [Solirubrobacteraceae bacterium]|nr:response regulator transcription factor [Solirubrobacteraceae bacterium]
MGNFGDALRVVLADDHQLFREGLRGLLEADGMVVVGEGADGHEAVALARQLQPDLLVIDLRMGSASGLDALRSVAASHPEISTVVVTVSAERADVLDALAAGARGYLLKDTSVDQLAIGVRQAAEGQIVISSALAGTLRTHVRAGARGEEHRQSLTPREQAVLRLMADGADNGEIGRELSISPHTVKQYVTNIFEKLGVRSRVQAAVHAVRVGLV